MSNVLEFRRRRPAVAPGPVLPVCPEWCSAEGEHNSHTGPLNASLEHDEQDEVVLAIGARMHSIAGLPPLVEFLLWDAEDNQEAKHLLTPNEARTLARQLMLTADQAERSQP